MSKWEMVKLRDVCGFIDYRGKTPEKSESGIPLITAKNVRNNSFSIEPQEFIPTESYESVMTRGIPNENDILFTTEAPLGNVCRIPHFETKFAVGQRIIVMQPKKEKLFPEFLEYSLKSNVFQIEMWKHSSGSTVKGIRSKELVELYISLPPLEVQKQIADILDKTQEIINGHKKQLEELDNLIKAIFYDMFGDPVKNTGNWNERNFTDILVLQRGYDLPDQERNKDGQVSVYGSNGIVDKHNEYKIKGGGVITGRSGTIGKVHYTFENYWPLNTTLFSKEYYDNNVIYLAYLLEFFDLKRFCTGTGVPTLNRNIVHDEKIIDVPLNLQSKFAAIAINIEKQKDIVKKSLEESQNLFNSLMNKYFE